MENKCYFYKNIIIIAVIIAINARAQNNFLAVLKPIMKRISPIITVTIGYVLLNVSNPIE